MSDENTVSLGYQELDDHNQLMQLIRILIDRVDELQFQYEAGGIIDHNESDTAHADIRQAVANIQSYLDRQDSSISTTLDTIANGDMSVDGDKTFIGNVTFRNDPDFKNITEPWILAVFEV